MFLPAKNEMTTHAQIESCKEYFLQFNYVYTPDRYIGLWWQFRTRLISDKDARAFITQVAPLGTMDYSLLQKRPPIIDTNYGFSLPVPPTTLVIGIIVIILLIAGIALGCYVYRMRKTLSFCNGDYQESNWKTSFRLSSPVFQDAQAHLTRYVSMYYTTTKDYRGYAPRPMQRKSTQSRWQKSWGTSSKTLNWPHKYTKHLDKKVQVDSFVSQEPEIVPDPESSCFYRPRHCATWRVLRPVNV